MDESSSRYLVASVRGVVGDSSIVRGEVSQIMATRGFDCWKLDFADTIDDDFFAGTLSFEAAHSDWADCTKARRSLSDGVFLYGCHVMMACISKWRGRDLQVGREVGKDNFWKSVVGRFTPTAGGRRRRRENRTRSTEVC